MYNDYLQSEQIPVVVVTSSNAGTAFAHIWLLVFVSLYMQLDSDYSCSPDRNYRLCRVETPDQGFLCPRREKLSHVQVKTTDQ